MRLRFVLHFVGALPNTLGTSAAAAASPSFTRTIEDQIICCGRDPYPVPGNQPVIAALISKKTFIARSMRRKLDRITSAQRQARRAVAMCHLPAQEPEECDALRSFVIEAVKRVSGAEPSYGAGPTPRRRSRRLPPSLVADARSAGVALTQQMRDWLDGDQRYVLTKLVGPAKSGCDCAARELFVNRQAHRRAIDTADFSRGRAFQPPRMRGGFQPVILFCHCILSAR